MTPLPTAQSRWNLGGAVCIVTGASGGIGACLASAAQRAGAIVVAVDIVRPTIDADLTLVLDVTDRSDCNTAAEAVLDTFGPISIVVNAAGILHHDTIFDEQFDNTLIDTIKVNLIGTANVIKAFAPQLIKTRGTVVNLGSIASFRGSAKGCAYAVSKHGVAGLTKSLALELGPSGVRVNALAPGRIETSMTATYRDDPLEKSKYFARTALRRYGTVEDLVGPFLFLASSQSAYLSGVILPVDGGYLAS